MHTKPAETRFRYVCKTITFNLWSVWIHKKHLNLIKTQSFKRLRKAGSSLCRHDQTPALTIHETWLSTDLRLKILLFSQTMTRPNLCTDYSNVSLRVLYKPPPLPLIFVLQWESCSWLVVNFPLKLPLFHRCTGSLRFNLSNRSPFPPLSFGLSVAEISPRRGQLRQGVHKDGGGADADRQALHHELGPERISRLLLHQPWVHHTSLRSPRGRDSAPTRAA